MPAITIYHVASLGGRTSVGKACADEMTFAWIEAAEPGPVRRRRNPGGGERTLGISTVRDRVVRTAAKLALEPIFEADLDPGGELRSFGPVPDRKVISL